MNVKPSGETREPRRGMYYREQQGGHRVQVRRVYPWGRGHRVQYEYATNPEQGLEQSLTAFRRRFVKEES